MGVFQEFKTFVQQGNVMDLAVGVIIGGAFGKIVSSLVADIIMPPIGLMLKGVNFKDLQLVIGTTADNKPIAVTYGNFFQSAIDFVIVAFVIFMLVKGVNALKKKPEDAPAAPPEPSNEEKLLAEIRDLLKAR